jgi:hypothetical protein
MVASGNVASRTGRQGEAGLFKPVELISRFRGFSKLEVLSKGMASNGSGKADALVKTVLRFEGISPLNNFNRFQVGR